MRNHAELQVGVTRRSSASAKPPNCNVDRALQSPRRKVHAAFHYLLPHSSQSNTIVAAGRYALGLGSSPRPFRQSAPTCRFRAPRRARAALRPPRTRPRSSKSTAASASLPWSVAGGVLWSGVVARGSGCGLLAESRVSAISGSPNWGAYRSVAEDSSMRYIQVCSSRCTLVGNGRQNRRRAPRAA
jgi:hypothetical protein